MASVGWAKGGGGGGGGGGGEKEIQHCTFILVYRFKDAKRIHNIRGDQQNMWKNRGGGGGVWGKKEIQHCTFILVYRFKDAKRIHNIHGDQQHMWKNSNRQTKIFKRFTNPDQRNSPKNKIEILVLQSVKATFMEKGKRLLGKINLYLRHENKANWYILIHVKIYIYIHNNKQNKTKQ